MRTSLQCELTLNGNSARFANDLRKKYCPNTAESYCSFTRLFCSYFSMLYILLVHNNAFSDVVMKKKPSSTLLWRPYRMLETSVWSLIHFWGFFRRKIFIGCREQMCGKTRIKAQFMLFFLLSVQNIYRNKGSAVTFTPFSSDIFSRFFKKVHNLLFSQACEWDDTLFWTIADFCGSETSEGMWSLRTK